jgi:hypothetical protein
VYIFSKVGTCTVGVPGIRLTVLKHAIGRTKLNYIELGHAAVGDLGRETVGVLGADRGAVIM